MVNRAIVATLEFLRTRKTAYQLTFQVDQPANLEVLIDLARFCRANESTVVSGDEVKSHMLAGRREVWLRIQQHLGLTPDQLFQLYSGNSPISREESKK
jgi:hypothetical protein